MIDVGKRLRELIEINRAIASTTDYDEVLHLVVHKACTLLDAKACLLLLAEPGRPAVLAASVGLPPAKVRDLHVILDERLHATLRDRFELSPSEGLVAVPMILRGDVRGTLVVFERIEPEAARAASREDEALLSALADQAALVLGHAAHLEQLEAALATADRERHAREETLSELSVERRWLRAVIEHSPTAILLVETPTAARVTGNVRADDLFGRRILPEGGLMQYAGQLCAPDGTPLPHEAIPAVRALRGEVVRGEIAVRRTDGVLVPVLVSAAGIPDERGGMQGAVVLYEDISALKELERLREEWTSAIAHDLRQPVHAISMRAQLLERDARIGAPKVQQAVEHILKSARNLNRMIDDLLDSSLLEAQRLVLVRKPQTVSTLLTEAIQRSTAALAGHRVELMVSANLPLVAVDPGRVEQVLMNLLANAAKYGASDTPIEVLAERRADLVEVAVRNHGPRIDPAIAAHLFERFRRGTKGEGLGLGLYISKGIVEGHGGAMWVESTEEGVTTFHFTLPTVSSEAPAAAPRSAPARSRRGPPKPRGSRPRQDASRTKG